MAAVFFNFRFSSKTKIEMNILILEYSNKSGVFDFYSMRRRFRVRGIFIVIPIDF